MNVAPWKRTGVRLSFINLVGSGRTCGGYVLEMPPRNETQPQRDHFEQLIYVIKGRGATFGIKVPPNKPSSGKREAFFPRRSPLGISTSMQEEKLCVI
jgi:hypothetical protein